jgi:hypothetical protein
MATCSTAWNRVKANPLVGDDVRSRFPGTLDSSRPRLQLRAEAKVLISLLNFTHESRRIPFRNPSYARVRREMRNDEGRVPSAFVSITVSGRTAARVPL